jgi:hypothetical protein
MNSDLCMHYGSHQVDGGFHQDSNGDWFFYDESGAYCYGPFDTLASAQDALEAYVETL